MPWPSANDLVHAEGVLHESCCRRPGGINATQNHRYDEGIEAVHSLSLEKSADNEVGHDVEADAI